MPAIPSAPRPDVLVAFQRRKTEAVGVKAPLPGFVEPALATSIGKVPSGDRWIHEIKFDGYRVQVHLANEAVQIFTRRGHDWTRRFKKVADDAWHIKAASAVVDGEIVVPAADGTTDFSVLQNELKGLSTKIAMVAFDLLYLNGRDLRKLPLHRRKAELRKIIAGTDIQFSESFEVDGPEMLAHACKVGLEGVVSKVRDSTYPTGRSNDWVKKTCAQRETLTIAGFALDGTKWDGLYVGRRKGDDLVYAGKVDHGFDKISAADLKRRLTPLVRKTQASHEGFPTRASGSSRSCWPRSSTARNPPRVRYDTRSSKDCGRIFDAAGGAAQAPPNPSERGSGGRKDPSSSLRTAGERIGSLASQEVPAAGWREPFIIHLPEPAPPSAFEPVHDVMRQSYL
jgi:bifunctional non-homologous end joining protein LigD